MWLMLGFYVVLRVVLSFITILQEWSLYEYGDFALLIIWLSATQISAQVRILNHAMDGFAI